MVVIGHHIQYNGSRNCVCFYDNDSNPSLWKSKCFNFNSLFYFKIDIPNIKQDILIRHLISMLAWYKLAPKISSIH